MRYATIRNMDIANGDGIRVSLFLQGCSHHCKGCFNESTWDFNGGTPFGFDTQDEFIKLAQSEFIDGISILGGEPLDNDLSELGFFLGRLWRATRKPIWMWTGYTIEEMSKYQLEIVQCYVDVLIDGRFDETKKDFRLKYRGSSNQRVIDVDKSSIFENKIILLED